MKLAKTHHPDKNGGDSTKVNISSFSLKKLVKLMKLLKTLRKDKCMINMAKMDQKWEANKTY
jgi:hypothetical protein